MGKKKRPAKEPTPRSWKVLSRVADKAGSAAGSKLVDTSWQIATGRKPPAKPDSPETTLRESLAWTVVSAAGVAVVKSLTTRRAAAYFQRSTGALPPTLRPIPHAEPASEPPAR